MSSGTVAGQFRTDLTAARKTSPDSINFIWYDNSLNTNIDSSLNQKFFLFKDGENVPLIHMGDGVYRTDVSYSIIDILFDDQEATGEEDSQDFYQSYLTHYQSHTGTTPSLDISINITPDSGNNTTIGLVNEFDDSNKTKPTLSYLTFDLTQIGDYIQQNIQNTYTVQMITTFDYLPNSNTDISNNIVINFNYRGITNIEPNETLYVRPTQENEITGKYLNITANIMSNNSKLEFLTDLAANESDLLQPGDGILPSVYFSTLLPSESSISMGSSVRQIPISIPWVPEIVGLSAGSWNWRVKLTDGIGEEYEQVQYYPIRLEVLPRFNVVDISLNGFSGYTGEEIVFSGFSETDMIVTARYNSNDVSDTDLMEWGKSLDISLAFYDTSNNEYVTLPYFDLPSSDSLGNITDDAQVNSDISLSLTLTYNGDDHLIDSALRDKYQLRVGQRVTGEQNFTFSESNYFDISLHVPYFTPLTFINNYDGTMTIGGIDSTILESDHYIKVTEKEYSIDAFDNIVVGDMVSDVSFNYNDVSNGNMSFDLSSNKYYTAEIFNPNGDFYNSVSATPFHTLTKTFPSSTLDSNESSDLTVNFGSEYAGTYYFSDSSFDSLTETWIDTSYGVQQFSFQLPHGVDENNVSLEIRTRKSLKSSTPSHVFDVSLGLYATDESTLIQSIDTNINSSATSGNKITTITDVSANYVYNLILETPETKQYGVELFVDIRVVNKTNANGGITELDDKFIFSRNIQKWYLRPNTPDYNGGYSFVLACRNEQILYLSSSEGQTLDNVTSIDSGESVTFDVDKITGGIYIELGHFKVDDGTNVYDTNNGFLFDNTTPIFDVSIFDTNDQIVENVVTVNDDSIDIDEHFGTIIFKYYLIKNGVRIQNPNIFSVSVLTSEISTNVVMNYSGTTNSDTELDNQGFKFNITNDDVSSLSPFTVDSQTSNFDISLTFTLPEWIVEPTNDIDTSMGIVLFVDKELIGIEGSYTDDLDISLYHVGGNSQSFKICVPGNIDGATTTNMIYTGSENALIPIPIDEQESGNSVYSLSISFPETRDRAVNYTIKTAVVRIGNLFQNHEQTNVSYAVYDPENLSHFYSNIYAVAMQKFYVRPTTETYRAASRNTVVTYTKTGKTIAFNSDTTSSFQDTIVHDEGIPSLFDSNKNVCNFDNTLTTVNFNATEYDGEDGFFGYDGHIIDTDTLSYTVTHLPYLKYDISSNIIISEISPNIRLLHKENYEYTLVAQYSTVGSTTVSVNNDASINTIDINGTTFVKIEDYTIYDSDIVRDSETGRTYFENIDFVTYDASASITSNSYTTDGGNVVYTFYFNQDSTASTHFIKVEDTDWRLSVGYRSTFSEPLGQIVNLEGFYGFVDISYNTIVNEVHSENDSTLRIGSMLPPGIIDNSFTYHTITFNIQDGVSSNKIFNYGGNSASKNSISSIIESTTNKINSNITGKSHFLSVGFPDKFDNTGFYVRISEDSTFSIIGDTDASLSTVEGIGAYLPNNVVLDVSNTLLEPVEKDNSTSINFNFYDTRTYATDAIYYIDLVYSDGFNNTVVGRTGVRFFIRPTVNDYKGNMKNVIYTYNQLDINFFGGDFGLTTVDSDLFAGAYNNSTYNSYYADALKDDEDYRTRFSAFNLSDSGTLDISLSSVALNGSEGYRVYTYLNEDGKGNDGSSSSRTQYAHIGYIGLNHDLTYGYFSDRNINGSTGGNGIIYYDEDSGETLYKLEHNYTTIVTNTSNVQTSQNLSGVRINGELRFSYKRIKNGIIDENENQLRIISLNRPTNIMASINYTHDGIGNINSLGKNNYQKNIFDNTQRNDIEIISQFTDAESTLNSGDTYFDMDLSLTKTSVPTYFPWFVDNRRLSLGVYIDEEIVGSEPGFESTHLSTFRINSSSFSGISTELVDLSNNTLSDFDISFNSSREYNATNVNVYLSMRYDDGTNNITLGTVVKKIYVRPTGSKFLGGNQLTFMTFSNSTITPVTSNGVTVRTDGNLSSMFGSDSDVYDGFDYGDSIKTHYFDPTTTFNLDLASLTLFSGQTFVSDTLTNVSSAGLSSSIGYSVSSSQIVIPTSSFGYFDIKFKNSVNSVVTEDFYNLRVIVVPRPVANNAELFGSIVLQNNTINNSSISFTNNGFYSRGLNTSSGTDFYDSINDTAYSGSLSQTTLYSTDNSYDVSFSFTRGSWANYMVNKNDDDSEFLNSFKVVFSWKLVNMSETNTSGMTTGINSESAIFTLNDGDSIDGSREQNLSSQPYKVTVTVPNGSIRTGGAHLYLRARLVFKNTASTSTSDYGYLEQVMASTEFKYFIRPGSDKYITQYQNNYMCHNLTKLLFYDNVNSLEQGTHYKNINDKRLFNNLSLNEKSVGSDYTNTMILGSDNFVKKVGSDNSNEPIVSGGAEAIIHQITDISLGTDAGGVDAFHDNVLLTYVNGMVSSGVLSFTADSNNASVSGSNELSLDLNYFTGTIDITYLLKNSVDNIVHENTSKIRIFVLPRPTLIYDVNELHINHIETRRPFFITHGATNQQKNGGDLIPTFSSTVRTLNNDDITSYITNATKLHYFGYNASSNEINETNHRGDDIIFDHDDSKFSPYPYNSIDDSVDDLFIGETDIQYGNQKNSIFKNSGYPDNVDAPTGAVTYTSRVTMARYYKIENGSGSNTIPDGESVNSVGILARYNNLSKTDSLSTVFKGLIDESQFTINFTDGSDRITYDPLVSHESVFVNDKIRLDNLDIIKYVQIPNDSFETLDLRDAETAKSYRNLVVIENVGFATRQVQYTNSSGDQILSMSKGKRVILVRDGWNGGPVYKVIDVEENFVRDIDFDTADNVHTHTEEGL